MGNCRPPAESPQLTREDIHHGLQSQPASLQTYSVNQLCETLGLGFPICKVGITALPASQAGGRWCERKHTGASEGPTKHSSQNQECSRVPMQPQRAVHTPLRPTRLAAPAPPIAVVMPGLVYLGLCLLPGSLGWRAPDTPLSPHHPAPCSPAGPASAPSPPTSERSLPRGLFHILSTFPGGFSSPGTSASTCRGLGASCKIPVQEETLRLTRRTQEAPRR